MHFIEGAVRFAAPPRARGAADSRGLNQAEPGGEQGRAPGQRDSKASAADECQPTRHDRSQASCDLVNSNHRATPACPGLGGRMAGRSGAGHDVKVAKTAHSPHRQRQ